MRIIILGTFKYFMVQRQWPLWFFDKITLFFQNSAFVNNKYGFSKSYHNISLINHLSPLFLNPAFRGLGAKLLLLSHFIQEVTIVLHQALDLHIYIHNGWQGVILDHFHLIQGVWRDLRKVSELIIHGSLCRVNESDEAIQISMIGLLDAHHVMKVGAANVQYASTVCV